MELVRRNSRWEERNQPFFKGEVEPCINGMVVALGAGTDASQEARRHREEYLLERRLLRRKSTGELVNSDWLQFSYPTRWYYDVLRGLDYFRTAGGPPDERLEEAVVAVRAKRQPAGRWLLENSHRGKVHFPLEDGDGKPSRWNTLRAMRVLKWYEGS